MGEVVFTRAECPACGGREREALFSRPFSDPNIQFFVRERINASAILPDLGDTNYTLLRCRNCGLIYQKNILSDEYLSKLYNEWVVHEERVPQSAEFFPYYANELYTIASLFDKPIDQIRVLDYGLGAGKWAKVAGAIGFNIRGTDLSAKLIESAMVSGISALPINEIGKHQFDFINTEQVFEHLPRPKDTIAELIRCLAPGGIIKISVPDGKGIERRLHLMDWSAPRYSTRFLIPVTPLMHINTFTDAAIRHMGEIHGMRAVRPSLGHEYNMLDATSLGKLAKSFVRPIYRRVARIAYVFLRRP